MITVSNLFQADLLIIIQSFDSVGSNWRILLRVTGASINLLLLLLLLLSKIIIITRCHFEIIIIDFESKHPLGSALQSRFFANSC